ncbi:PIN domain-containing protein [Amycolatopsis samaneae]|uniref:Uncharacterized protein n=1 Tax=Amycolatopsis samaneae TaxID=664691 RepID=A0ABW5GTM1_9PSEU
MCGVPKKLGAAIASSRELPLYACNADDFKGLGNIVEVIAV